MDLKTTDKFWTEHNPAENKHADFLLKSLVDRRKELLVQSQKILPVFVLSLVSFWLIAFQKGSDLSLFGIHFSNPMVLLVALPLLLSFLFYRSVLHGLHILAIEEVIQSYFRVCLPASVSLNLSNLLNVDLSESRLSDLGYLKSSRAIVWGLILAFLHAGAEFVLSTMTVVWLAIYVELETWDAIRIIAVMTSVLFSVRAVWMLTEYVVLVVKRLWRSLQASKKPAV